MRKQQPEQHQNRIITKRLWVPVFMMISISILSGSAGIQTGGWSFKGMDKLGHLVVFGLLGIAWARSFKGDLLKRGERLCFSILLTTAFGLADEMHQYHNPLRTFEWADLLADFAGSVMASWIYLYVNPAQRLLESKISQYLRLPLRNKKTDSLS